MKTQHKKDWCEHYETLMVVCGACGNNTCNAGYGMINGNTCTDCPSAYELFDKGPEEINKLPQRI